MPGMADPNFSASVTYICQHDEAGASGLTINRDSGLCVAEVLEHINIDCLDQELHEKPVLIGGPVNPESGFVLHSRGGQRWGSSYVVNDLLTLTTSRDILDAIALGEGPSRMLFALGYSGWGPGQLEQEMLDNAWLSTPAPLELLFEAPVGERWRLAAEQLGVDLSLLSNQAGHA